MYKVMVGINDLATTMPEIAAEWDYENNGGLTPQDVMAGSNRRVWWKCKRGHSWRTAVYHRKAGHGCPYCTSLDSAVRRGENDLLTKCPEIARQWDFEKNPGYSPDSVAYTSMLKVWWRCEHGHSWQAAINKRVCRKQGCPYCANLKPIIGETDLVTTMPEIAAEWDFDKNGGLTPQDVMAGTGRKIWWRCKNGHSWQAPPYSRKAGYNCPFCAGNTLIKGVNDLATVDPHLASEWNQEKNKGLDPFSVSVCSAKKVWWKCRNGHEWTAAVSSRHKGRQCPYCTGKKVLPGYNDLATLAPELLNEWDWERNQIRPEHIQRGSNFPVWWVCVNGHHWHVSPASRSSGTGCPYCAGTEILSGFNDVLTLHPKLIKSWDFEKNTGIDPHKLASSSKLSVWWKCEKGHSWETSISNRVHHGCPYCANRAVLPGYNDLLSQNPQLAAQWDHEKNGNLKPDAVTFRQRKSVYWRCELQHSWKSEVYERYKGVGCPYCSGKRVLPGFNDLATRYPELLEEWDYERNLDVTPDKILPHTNRKVWWKCKLHGHHFRSAVNSRSKGIGCPYCYGHLPSRTKLVP